MFMDQHMSTWDFRMYCMYMNKNLKKNMPTYLPGIKGLDYSLNLHPTPIHCVCDLFDLI